MNKNRLALALAVALMLTPALPAALAASGLTVMTSSRFYKPGATVAISGTATAAASVALTVSNVKGQVASGTATAGADGKYTHSFALAADAYKGLYTVESKAGEESAKTVFTVTAITPSDWAQSQVDVAEDAQARVEALFEKMEAEGVEIPEAAQENYDEGVAKLGEAKALLAEGKGVEALRLIHQAHQHFTRAIAAPRRAEAEAKIRARVGQAYAKAVEAAQKLATRLEEQLGKLEEKGKDVAAAKAALEEAKGFLESAKAYLDEGKTAEAKAELAKAKEAFEEVYAGIRNLNQKGKGPLGFFEHADSKAGKFENKGGKGKKDD